MVNITHSANSQSMQNAIKKARSIKPTVKFIGFRNYQVSGSTGNLYTVSFSVNPQNGTHQAHCTCRAGEVGQLCFHVVAAVQVHAIVQGMRVHAKVQREAVESKPTMEEMSAAPVATPRNYGQTCGAFQV